MKKGTSPQDGPYVVHIRHLVEGHEGEAFMSLDFFIKALEAKRGASFGHEQEVLSNAFMVEFPQELPGQLLKLVGFESLRRKGRGPLSEGLEGIFRTIDQKALSLGIFQGPFNAMDPNDDLLGRAYLRRFH